MSNVIVSMPEDLREEIQRHREFNWNAFIRKSVEDHIKKLNLANAIASKSRLTEKDVEELDKLVKKGIAKQHGLT